VEAPPVKSNLLRVGLDAVTAMPERLREAQAGFAVTGGLHATGLFSAVGELLCLREDVGRHNAMDKVIGRAFLDGRLPLAGAVLCVSGRLSFELVQKAAIAGCPVLVAVGCAQLVYVKDDEVTQIEGDPASPISRGRLCPKGSATLNYVQSPLREYKVKYRRPYGTRWEELALEDAMEMIADRVIQSRDRNWDERNNRTMAIAHLGGATLDNEENYLIKKLLSSLGVVQVENQARI
jgi:formate dehydrogenase major subunit